MNDVLGMEVAVEMEADSESAGDYFISPSRLPQFSKMRGSLHALGSLPGHINELDHVKACVSHMKVVVEAGTLTPLCNDGKPGPSHETHEQQNVDMSCLPVGRERRLEGRGQKIEKVSCIYSVTGKAMLPAFTAIHFTLSLRVPGTECCQIPICDTWWADSLLGAGGMWMS